MVFDPLKETKVGMFAFALRVIVSVALALVDCANVVGLVEVDEMATTVPAELALTPIACRLVSVLMALVKPDAIVVKVSAAKTVYVTDFCPPANAASFTVIVSVLPVVFVPPMTAFSTPFLKIVEAMVSVAPPLRQCIRYDIR